MSPARILPLGHPDRFGSVEEAIEPAYQALVDKMLRAGIDEREIALAVESLAQAHLGTINANEITEAEIDHVRREAGMPERNAAPAWQQWTIGVGIAAGFVLLFSVGFLLAWAIARFLL